MEESTLEFLTNLPAGGRSAEPVAPLRSAREWSADQTRSAFLEAHAGFWTASCAAIQGGTCIPARAICALRAGLQPGAEHVLDADGPRPQLPVPVEVVHAPRAVSDISVARPALDAGPFTDPGDPLAELVRIRIRGGRRATRRGDRRRPEGRSGDADRAKQLATGDSLVLCHGSIPRQPKGVACPDHMPLCRGVQAVGSLELQRSGGDGAPAIREA